MSSISIGYFFPGWDSRFCKAALRGQGLNIGIIERCKKLFVLRPENSGLFTRPPESSDEMVSVVYSQGQRDIGEQAVQQILPKPEDVATRRQLYNWGALESAAIMPNRETLTDTNECYYIDRLYFSRINQKELDLIDRLTTAGLQIAVAHKRYFTPSWADETDPNIVLLFERIVVRKEAEVELRLAQQNPYSRNTAEDRENYDRWHTGVQHESAPPVGDPKSQELMLQVAPLSLQELREALDKDLAIRKQDPTARLFHFTYNWPRERSLLKSLAVTSFTVVSLALGTYYMCSSSTGFVMARL